VDPDVVSIAILKAGVRQHAAAKFPHGGVSRIREAIATENLRECSCQDAEIEPQTPVLHVPEIMGEFLLPIEVVTPIHLRPSGDSGADIVAAHLLRRIAVEICSE